MASEDQTKVEEEVAGLSLQEKAGVVGDVVNEYVEGVKDAAQISAADVKGELDSGSAKEASETVKDSQELPLQSAKEASETVDSHEQPLQDSNSREVNIAAKEAQKSPDEGAYVVPTVDHRSVQEPGGEEKVEVPTGIVHENADPADKPQQQGKGLIQSITQSVKSAFSGLTGGKVAKSSEAKGEASSE